jgi:hypothetical protein
MPSHRSAGYSGKRLAEKLGLRDGMRVSAPGAPPGYPAWLGPTAPTLALGARVTGATDLVHYFVAWRRELEGRVVRLNRVLRDDAVLWISWPKKSSGVPTDLTEDALREVLLPLGLVDVKVCAVDATWSGLKFVRRLRHRRSTTLT